MDRSYFEKIIEREFRKAVNAMPHAPMYVDMSVDEEITVSYRMGTYVCDCSGDEEFVFICLENPSYRVSFPIPDDYLV